MGVSLDTKRLEKRLELMFNIASGFTEVYSPLCGSSDGYTHLKRVSCSGYEACQISSATQPVLWQVTAEITIVSIPMAKHKV